MSPTITIFISYAREDEILCQKLEQQLQALRRQSVIAVWHDRNISAGSEWKQQISSYLDTAHLILLLISADFLASDYCYSIEMQRAMERHNKGEARVIPVLLRPVDCEGTPFANLSKLPLNDKPVTSADWDTLDDALHQVAIGIKNAVFEILVEQALHEAQNHVIAEQYEQALLMYDQVLQLDTHALAAYIAKGDLLYRLKRYEEAITMYEHAHLQGSEGADIYFKRADALLHLRQYTQALEAAEQGVKRHTQSALGFLIKGYSLLNLKRFKEALIAYNRALQLDPALPEINSGRGLALLGLKQYEEALIAYDQAIACDPTMVMAYSGKGDVLFHLQRYDEALDAYERATQLDPTYADAHAGKGRLYEKLAHEAYLKAKQHGYVEEAAQQIDRLYTHSQISIAQAGAFTLFSKIEQVHNTSYTDRDLIASVTMSPDGEFVASIEKRHQKIIIYNVKTGEPIQTFQGFENPEQYTQVHHIVFSFDGRVLIGSGMEKAMTAIKLWNAQTGELIHTYRTANAWCGAIDPDRQTFVGRSTADEKITIIDFHTGQILGQSSPIDQGYNIQCLAVGRAGDIIVSDGSVDISYGKISTINLWDAHTLKHLHTIAHFGSLLVSLAVNPDGQNFASGHSNGLVKFWNLPGGQFLNAFDTHTSSAVTAIAFSPDGQKLITYDSEERIKIWARKFI